MSLSNGTASAVSGALGELLAATGKPGALTLAALPIVSILGLVALVVTGHDGSPVISWLGAIGSLGTVAVGGVSAVQHSGAAAVTRQAIAASAGQQISPPAVAPIVEPAGGQDVAG